MGRDANRTISLIASYDRRLKRPLPASNLITGSQKNKCSQGSLIWTQWTCQVPRNHLIVVRFRRERTMWWVPSAQPKADGWRTSCPRVHLEFWAYMKKIWKVRVRWSSTLSRISPLRNYCPMLWVTSIWNKEGVLLPSGTCSWAHVYGWRDEYLDVHLMKTKTGRTRSSKVRIDDGERSQAGLKVSQSH